MLADIGMDIERAKNYLIANKIIDRYRGGYSDKDAMEHLNNFGVDRLYGTEITSIMDWVRVGLNGNLSEYKNLKCQVQQLYHRKL
jgi:hypothetical protein